MSWGGVAQRVMVSQKKKQNTLVSQHLQKDCEITEYPTVWHYGVTERKNEPSVFSLLPIYCLQFLEVCFIRFCSNCGKTHTTWNLPSFLAMPSSTAKYIHLCVTNLQNSCLLAKLKLYTHEQQQKKTPTSLFPSIYPRPFYSLSLGIWLLPAPHTVVTVQYLSFRGSLVSLSVTSSGCLPVAYVTGFPSLSLLLLSH